MLQSCRHGGEACSCWRDPANDCDPPRLACFPRLRTYGCCTAPESFRLSAFLEVRTTRLAVIALALVYGALQLGWYGGTPLGHFPVLDGREMLVLARSMADGTLPAEPFYRAPLYPALLSIFMRMGAPDALMPDVARLINLLAHLAAALLVYELARRVWTDVRAGLLAGVFYSLYPVALDLAGDPMDVTLGTALALAGTLSAWVAYDSRRFGLAVLAAAWFCLAALARPNFLFCLPALVVWLGLQSWRDRRHWRLLAGTLGGMALVLGAMGLVNLRIGHEFRVLPWQGMHGIWDGNGPGANGLFYSHSIDVPDLVPGANPARAEAQIIYCRDRPCSGALDIDDFQAYWRGRMVEHLRQHPQEWLRLMRDKTWYLLNNYEQYNNKTYWVHKERSPWLRWNPLCWAVLLAASLSALWLPLRREAREWLLLCIGCYALSLLAVYVSGRFRVSLAGWLCVLLGGWASVHSRVADVPNRRWVAAAVTAIALGIAAAWPVPDHLRQGTVTEDWMLMSSAALAGGDWQESEAWAARVLERTPRRETAHAMICSARFHAWEQAPTAELPPDSWLRASLEHCLAGSPGSDRAAYNAGFFLLGICRADEADAIWLRLADSRLIGELARNARAAIGKAAPSPEDAVAGLLRLQRQPASDLSPGLRSILSAVVGAQCNASGNNQAGRSVQSTDANRP